KKAILNMNYNTFSFHLGLLCGDLYATFFVFFPIRFHLRRDVGVNLIWVAVVGDWLNLTKFYGPIKRPELQQLSITCETGPGILQYSLQYLFQAYLFACSFILVTSLYSLDSASLLHARSGALVAVGLLLPVIIVAEIFSRVQWIYSAGLRKNISVTVFLLFFAVGFYVLLKAVGVDLLWTLAKAQKWCLNPDWVLLDTTPFASLLRNMGTLFGLGLGLHLSGYSETLLFYSLSFCKSAVALVLPTALIPGVIYWMFIKKQS
uniref:Glucose-6-phosphatase a, catalytic subunit, tandem duplicate 1 n=1 Tax=Cyprinus carpio TaxID=7962 RepID=A0A8C2H719_CYPCA